MLYHVTLHHQGQTYHFEASDDQPILDAAEQVHGDLPFSCRAGVCTTCAARIISGSVDQDEALGVAPELKEKGYTLLCVARALSDLEIEGGKEDEVYALQFGNGS
jgi:ferredoxin